MEKNNKLVISIISIGLLSFLGIVIETALNITFPRLMRAFSISASTVQWLTTGYMLVSTVLIPFGAFLRKRCRIISLFRIAVFSFLAGTICAGFAEDFLFLLLGRLLQGVAAGIGLPLMFSLILEQAPRRSVGTFMGIGSLVIAFAPAVGPAYGGVIQRAFSWHMLFILLLPLIIITWLLGEFSIQQVAPTKKVAFDLRGGISLAALLTATLLLIVNLTSGNGSLILQILLIVIIIISCAAFLYFERNNPQRLLEITLLKNTQFISLLIPFFLLQLMSLSMSYLVPNVLELGFKQSTTVAGFLVLPAAVADAMVAAVAGLVYDKINRFLPILVGTGLIMLTFLAANLLVPSVITLVLTYTIFMVGLGFSYSNIMTLSLSRLSTAVTNDGNAIYMTVQSYSGAVGIALSASLISFAQKQSADLEMGTKAGLNLNLLVLLCLAIIVLCFCLISVRQSVRESVDGLQDTKELSKK
ncbi:hypothetical protein FC81_GL000543 [Liquorilactobacillus capillatus DSM 19910]|uniref:Major facilitator superfamily (MFS) profile domain-containing protein n=1 Tax=Liquorilactobacillus capillatus DSM 19910 TaxID=1423731 RepID=A0A0R1M7K3_9LACO|nr:hypothetical protein FC81_GL000543 [Liquorilactobacillus capillatus DSM 19910]